MSEMIDLDRIREIKDRLADRYSTAELVELLNVPVEDIIETYWEVLIKYHDVLDEVGGIDEKEDDE